MAVHTCSPSAGASLSCSASLCAQPSQCVSTAAQLSRPCIYWLWYAPAQRATVATSTRWGAAVRIAHDGLGRWAAARLGHGLLGRGRGAAARLSRSLGGRSAVTCTAPSPFDVAPMLCYSLGGAISAQLLCHSGPGARSRLRDDRGESGFFIGSPPSAGDLFTSCGGLPRRPTAAARDR